MLKSIILRLFRISSIRTSRILEATDKCSLLNSTNLMRRGYVTLRSNSKQPDFSNYQTTIRHLCSKTEPQPQQNVDESVSIYTSDRASDIRFARICALPVSMVYYYILVHPILFEVCMKTGGAALATFMCTSAGVFTLATPFLLYSTTKKHATDIAYNLQNDEYTAIIISRFLLREKITFKVDDIALPDFGRMYTFLIGPKEIPLYVEPTEFTDLQHHSRFMGYDKPIVFKLEPDPEDSSSQK